MIGTLEDVKRDMEHGVYDFTENRCYCNRCVKAILEEKDGENCV